MQNGCELCPRHCGARRDLGERGVCGMGDRVRVARAALHPFEEPSISGTRGSGTVFFVGCSLGCVFCQNREIRGEACGYELDEGTLGEVFLALQAAGAHNINLVTATHFSDQVAAALRAVRSRLHIPVVYNCGGYELEQTIDLYEGLVDVYLPDFKYISPNVSRAYSAAPDYAEHASRALVRMWKQVGAARFDGEGLMTRGVMVRHLVLPGTRADSIAVLERIASLVPVDEIRLSLMRQYTPDFVGADAPDVLKRRLTSFEYDTVAKRAESLGFDGYFQGKGSASAAFTPDFEQRDILREILE